MSDDMKHCLTKEFYLLDSVQASLRDAMKKIETGSYDINKVRMIKDLARSTIETTCAQLDLLSSFSRNDGLIVNCKYLKPNALPEIASSESTLRPTATGYEQEILRENGFRILRHVLT